MTDIPLNTSPDVVNILPIRAQLSLNHFFQMINKSVVKYVVVYINELRLFAKGKNNRSKSDYVDRHSGHNDHGYAELFDEIVEV